MEIMVRAKAHPSLLRHYERPFVTVVVRGPRTGNKPVEATRVVALAYVAACICAACVA